MWRGARSPGFAPPRSVPAAIRWCSTPPRRGRWCTGPSPTSPGPGFRAPIPAPHANPPGVLSYSELLRLRTECTERLAADERHEVTRLCEGVVRLEQLLQTVRQTVDRAPSAAPDAHVADVVERSIAPAHVQWPLHADRSDDSSTPSWS